MGFLDREKEIEKKDAGEKRFIWAVSAGNVAKPTFDNLRPDDLDYGPEDNAKIGELLDNLPQFKASFGIRNYLWMVGRHTGYESSIYLYTRDKGLRGADSNLRSKLFRFYDSFDYESRTLHPEEMFCGESIKPVKWFLFPISEPQEPGIGIHFSKKLHCLSEYNGQYNLDIFTYLSNHVFVRFILPATAFITGSGNRVAMTGLEQFDDVLEESFRHPHKKIFKEAIRHVPIEPD